MVEERESVAGGRGIVRNLYLGGQFVIFPYRISTQKKIILYIYIYIYKLKSGGSFEPPEQSIASPLLMIL